ncbi:MAG: lytic transglycosylase domain-containing protein [Gemmatimonadota bacterium]
MRRVLRHPTWALLLLIACRLPAQSPLADAEAAISSGQPWRATQLMAPVLADSATRTPEAIMVAARAAAGWEGWSRVRQLLERTNWLDTKFDRAARRLLTEAALAERRDSDAVSQARLAVAPSSERRSPKEQGERLLLLARALDRTDARDSAAATYARAAALLPDVSDWIVLRAAGVSDDSSRRAALLARVTLPAALPRVPWTEALARERASDFAGAATAYGRVGAVVSALRMRWRAARTGADSARVVAAALALLAPESSAAQSRDALDLLDRLAPWLTRPERLVVARRAAAVGRSVQAMDAFAAAAKQSPLTGADRFTYGTVLGQLNRWPDAAKQFRGVTVPALAGHAAYFTARAQLRAGNGAAAIPALRRVVAQFPRDTVAAAVSLYLLGDLAIDGGQLDSARALFLRLADRYPTATERPRALLLAAIIALQRGAAPAAVRELEAAIARPMGGEGDAMRYWLARARLAAGDSSGARNGWRALVANGPESYYALRAAARLDTVPWRVESLPELTTPDSLRAALGRAARLDSLGLDVESRMELDRLMATAQAAGTMLVLGNAFAANGLASRAQQAGFRAASAGASRGPALWQLLYPLPFEAALRATAERAGVDPMLAASVIRQESGFVPHATSRTDARGLMQVMPATGRDLARSAGISDFDTALLWVPDVNLALGMRHFGAALKRYPEIERALAAYNAGGTPVARWSASQLDGTPRSGDAVRAPVADIEMFVERIPYVETRDYVRIILRNYAMYRMLYGSGGSSR